MISVSIVDVAFLTDEYSLSYLKEYKNCEIVPSSKDYIPAPISNAFPKNSTFKGIFNHFLGVLKERGTFNKIMLKYGKPEQGKLKITSTLPAIISL